MGDIEDLPVVGRVVGVLTVLVDVVLNSGDLVVAGVVGLAHVALGNVDLLLPLMSTLSRLSDTIAWLPADAVETAFTVVLVAALASYAARFLGAALGRKSEKKS